ncbi:RTA1 like protein-domain-containing protein [Aspergillus pseudoustus]|uniref:RTA1 like protein-domain-containing protein n=1 Tax=Aspergillus pseudoustus TaxID=1810923 RepID=A0ABR4JDJ7_9EURO
MAEYILYNYTPSLAVAVVALLLFLAATVAHIFLAIKHRLKFLIAFIIGGFFETIGYAARAVNAHQAPRYETLPYAMQSVFILLAPSLFAASIYMILGRLIRRVDGDSRSPIKSTKLTRIFVIGDILAFLVQGGGGAILTGAKSASKEKLGENVIIAGLFVQIIFFGFFVIVVATFHKRIVANPTTESVTCTVNWKRYLLILYFASAMIMVRCIYRVVEYIQGQTGALQRHEYYAYIFDTLLMFQVVIVFVIFHPSHALSRDTPKIADTELIYQRLNE